MATNMLAQINAARKALVEAANIEEVLEIKDKAAAVALFAKAKGAKDAAQFAKEIELRAERKAGGMIPEFFPPGGNKNARSHDVTLEKAGISKMQSSRWQKIASIPEQEFEDVIATMGAEDKELTQALLLKIAAGLDWYQSSESIEWGTPQWLFDRLHEEFGFQTDVCASAKNAKCKRFYNKKKDGLKQHWAGVCWMNPPYGREIAEWMAKARESAERGATIVCLVPARPDTDWWWRNALKGEIRFLRGRLKWPDSKTAAPFPSAVIILKPKISPGKVVWWEISEKN